MVVIDMFGPVFQPGLEILRTKYPNLKDRRPWLTKEFRAAVKQEFGCRIIYRQDKNKVLLEFSNAKYNWYVLRCM